MVFLYKLDFSFFIFSIGGESLAVAQNTYAVSWFKGKELNLVFGLQLSMARIVSMANLIKPNRKQKIEFYKYLLKIIEWNEYDKVGIDF